MQSIRVQPIFAALMIVGLVIAGIAGAQQPQRFPRLTAEQAEILSHLSIVHLDDGQGGLVKTIRFTGVNVQIVNGLGATNGRPEDPSDPSIVVTNGVGNLLIGYHEAASTPIRTGSHNIVCGVENAYSSCGTVVSGGGNRTSAPYSLATGLFNAATSKYAAVVGGESNTSGAPGSVVIGGQRNKAGGSYYPPANAVVVGGFENEAQSGHSVVAGGTFNKTLPSSGQSLVGGGVSNVAWSSASAVIGGQGNVADGDYGCITGGHDRSISVANPSGLRDHDWVAGDLWQDQ